MGDQLALFDAGEKLHKVSFNFGANADICVNRHKGNAASVEANKKTDKARDRETILNYFRCRGRSYLKEVERNTGIGKTTVSGRLSELKADGILRETDVRKEGCCVLELVKK
jgi:hypothetical protein